MENPYFVARAREGISINGKEWLLDAKGEPMEFESPEKAKEFLKENGYDSYSDEELEDTFFFQQDFK